MTRGEREAEASVAEIGVHDMDRPGRQQIGQRDLVPADMAEIARAQKMQRARFLVDAQPHAETGADAFEQGAVFGDALDRADRDNGAVVAPVIAGPDDAVAVLPGELDVALDVAAGERRQRRAEQAAEEREQPAGRARIDAHHATGIDNGLARDRHGGEACADRRRQPMPAATLDQSGERREYSFVARCATRSERRIECDGG